MFEPDQWQQLVIVLFVIVFIFLIAILVVVSLIKHNQGSNGGDEHLPIKYCSDSNQLVVQPSKSLAGFTTPVSISTDGHIVTTGVAPPPSTILRTALPCASTADGGFALTVRVVADETGNGNVMTWNISLTGRINPTTQALTLNTTPPVDTLRVGQLSVPVTDPLVLIDPLSPQHILVNTPALAPASTWTAYSLIQARITPS